MHRLAKLFRRSEEAPPPEPPPAWSPSAVAELLRQFPVGSRVLYYPELKRELRLESIVLACSLNNRHVVYSPQELTLRKNGGEPELCLVQGAERAPLAEIRSFHLLIPHQNRLEIDYRPQDRDEAPSRFTQSTINDFERHSVITLVSYSPYGRVPHLQTLVKGTSVLTTGYYANQKVVVLDPLPHGLSYLDKRRHQRVRTSIPVTLRSGADGPTHTCTLDDFSERFLRLRTAPPSASDQPLTVGCRVAIRLDLSPHGRSFLLQGSIFRQAGGALVVELQGILRDGRFDALHLVDELDLKASLLQHPATRQLQSAHTVD
ncbi:MAG: PilZ domain-containing protein [Deltaproteobacteria bacterium]|nr:PilZ domain-containing protein [Deltaproteobacteria bacterium]